MKQPMLAARVNVNALVAAEFVAAATALVVILAGAPVLAAIACGVVCGLLVCVMTLAGLPLWRWAWLGVSWVRHRQRRFIITDPRAHAAEQENTDAPR